MKTVAPSTVVFCPDIWFVIGLKMNEGGYWCDFNIYEVAQVDDENGMFYQESGAHCFPTPTNNIEEAEIACTGFIKWDGCAEFDWTRQHVCAREQATNMGEVMRRIYEEAAKLSEKFEG